MTKSDALDQLATALAKAQLQFKPAKKDSTNPFFKSNYADLSAVWEVLREPLGSNGLSVIQTLYTETVAMSEDVTKVHTFLETTLMHASGQWITSTILLKPTKDDAQGMGSAITYFRRYALQAITGATSEDDDGNQASTPQTKPYTTTRPTTTTHFDKTFAK